MMSRHHEKETKWEQLGFRSVTAYARFTIKYGEDWESKITRTASATPTLPDDPLAITYYTYHTGLRFAVTAHFSDDGTTRRQVTSIPRRIHDPPAPVASHQEGRRHRDRPPAVSHYSPKRKVIVRALSSDHNIGNIGASSDNLPHHQHPVSNRHRMVTFTGKHSSPVRSSTPRTGHQNSQAAVGRALKGEQPSSRRRHYSSGNSEQPTTSEVDKIRPQPLLQEGHPVKRSRHHSTREQTQSSTTPLDKIPPTVQKAKEIPQREVSSHPAARLR